MRNTRKKSHIIVPLSVRFQPEKSWSRKMFTIGVEPCTHDSNHRSDDIQYASWRTSLIKNAACCGTAKPVAKPDT
jgi:hypothetical protein